MADQLSDDTTSKSANDSKKPLSLRGWWIVLALSATFLSGGLAGQVFNWLVNRHKPSIVSYHIVTTTLAAPEVAGLIPNLRVLIGQEPIKALYAHSIDLSAQDYIKSVEVGLDFSSAPHIYGFKPFENAFNCMSRNRAKVVPLHSRPHFWEGPSTLSRHCGFRQ